MAKSSRRSGKKSSAKKGAAKKKVAYGGTPPRGATGLRGGVPPGARPGGHVRPMRAVRIKKTRAPIHLFGKGKKAPSAQLAQTLAVRTTAALTTAAAGPPQPPPTVDFADFFQRVGEGLVKAQQNMDSQSLDYLKSVVGQPNLLPSMFRIPKVSADLKFALDTEKSNTVGFIFYKDETSEQTHNQQSIQFDIVSVPATQVPPAPLFVNLVFSASQRQSIFDALRTLNDPGAAAPLANQNRVLIYAPDGTNSYFLAYAEQTGATQVGFWFFVVNPAALVTLRKPGDAGPPALDALRDLIFQQGQAQDKFLKQLGGSN
jgi:hypothetical protein